ncbi:putative inner membrane protein [Methylophaga frappieri]|uniref:Putative inner membrane protein n=1 Tax=Methylophaga frappieri (strain ATCC BAA-2434 / DSM 25690 / JAM7) TaxID=754477 RepID=I1YJX7_METFJ|nr:MFS transporter [Methylophaga frappieri]AFJ03220.1 putative inner membrane protein [Methylophaga frappieri]
MQTKLSQFFNVDAQELPAVLVGILMFFLLFTGYFLLRPVRETMGIAGGVDNLQWLFTGTFLATLAALPCFGWLASRVPRRQILPWLYGFFALNLVAFAVLFQGQESPVWAARSFYIWLSVFNLMAISLAWSILADIFNPDEAKRLFAMIAGGASLGGLTGPVLGILLVTPLGHSGLVLISAGLLLASAASAIWLRRWRDRHPLAEIYQINADQQGKNPLGGNPFSGAGHAFKSPFLLGIIVFVLLLASVSTFLYFEQARLVAERFPDPVQQTQVFGVIDTVVQTLAIITQLLITGHLARRFGVTVLLVAVPIIVAFGFLWLAFAPVFAILAVVMVARRFGEYALVRPGREMLYTAVPDADKYKAKNFIDTVVYRGGDAISGWVKRGIDLLAENPSVAMLLGSVLAAVWAFTGWLLGRAYRVRLLQKPSEES